MAKKNVKAPVEDSKNGGGATTAIKTQEDDRLHVNGRSDQSVRGAGDAGVEGELAMDPLPSVFVNKSNLGEIKGALDDIVKKHLEGQAFKPSLLHPTVHLSLGYTSIIFAFASSLYSFKYPFEESKPVLWIGVSVYFILQGVMWGWKRWVEKGEVFSGKRRRIIKRIETDFVRVESYTSLDDLVVAQPQITFSPHTRPSSPSLQPTSPIKLSPSSTLPLSNPSSPSSPTSSVKTLSHSRDITTTSTTSTTTASSTPIKANGPIYSISLNLSTTSNNGKSLIHKSRVVAGKTIGEFIDENGGVEEGQVTRWLSGLLVDAGLVGAEEEGKKEE